MSVLFTKRGTPPSLGKKASDYAVGESVFLPVNGVNTEFLVVHQGNPNGSIYSTTFNGGTVLLMKDCYENRQWNSANINNYAGSTIHSHLNNTFYGLLGTAAKSAVKQVKIPYRPGSGTSKTCDIGENGLICYIFLLSMAEVGYSADHLPVNEGVKLDYFESENTTSAKAKRMAYLNGSKSYWYLRTPATADSTKVYYVGSDGTSYGTYPTSNSGQRPALVIDGNTLFDPDTNIIKG